MPQPTFSARVLLISLTLVACADDTRKDLGEDEACPGVSESVVVSAAGATVRGSTALKEAGRRSLGECGSYYPAGPALPPQDLIRVKVAAAGPSVLHFTLSDPGTDAAFDTLVQVWDGCDEPPASGVACFDDETPGEGIASGGYVAVAAGQVLYFLVTGVAGIEMDRTGRVSEGAYVAHFELFPLTQPTLLGATALLDSSVSTLTIVSNGADSAADVRGVVLTSLVDEDDAELLDRDADGVVLPHEQLHLAFASSPEAEFAGATLTLDAVTVMSQYGIDINRARRLTVALEDAHDSRSDPRVVEISVIAYGGAGAACDGELLRCSRGLLCGTDSTCAVSEAALAYCDAPITAFVLEAPEAERPSVVSATGVFEDSASGALFGSCAQSDSAEQSFAVDVPAGDFDLVVRVTGTITGEPTSDAPPFDSVVYIRSECSDPASELACNDDGDPSLQEYWSLAQANSIAPGTYRVIAEFQGGLGEPYSAPYTIEFHLRSIVAEDEACDPMGLQSRCSIGTCVTEGAPSGRGVCRVAGSD